MSDFRATHLHDHAHAAVKLLWELLRRPSITPKDEGCQQLLAERLTDLGFACEHLQFGEVSNLWARFGAGTPLFCFAGHTDVVPVGNRSDWRFDPFEPCICDNHVYGRGAVDMKGGIAAMIVAAEEFLNSAYEFDGSIAFLFTSDEEGPAVDGTRRVLQTLKERGEKIDWCVIGEPSSSRSPGDVVRIGRRGSLTGELRVNGVQGHVAYPHLADNPNHTLMHILADLQQECWDNGNLHFPATSFQTVALKSGANAVNIIPSEASTIFNFRYSTEWDSNKLQAAVTGIVEKHTTNFDMQWTVSGEPFLTTQGTLVKATIAAISDVCGQSPELSTGGGTSDGRFIAPSGAEVVELGLVNDTAHKTDENVDLAHVELLCTLYQKILQKLLLNRQP